MLLRFQTLIINCIFKFYILINLNRLLIQKLYCIHVETKVTIIEKVFKRLVQHEL